MNLAMREKGQFPLSIGSSLAVEGALGIHPDHPLPTSLLRSVSEVWFNVYTVFRNLNAAMKAEDQRGAQVPELYAALVEDLLGCQTVIDQESHGRCEAVFYLNDYSDLAKRFPRAKLKVPTTDNQLIYQALETATLQRLLDGTTPVPLKRYKGGISEIHPASLMVTHYPVDLLARYQFSQLSLLESHTGKVKPPSQWNTKLNGSDPAKALLPFNAFTLQVMGDGQQFAPQLTALRKAVYTTASATKWSSVTSMDKIKMTLAKTVKDPAILTQLEAFY